MTTVMNEAQAKKLVKIINDSLYKPGIKLTRVTVFNQDDNAVAGEVSFDNGKFEPIFLEAASPVIEKEPVKDEPTPMKEKLESPDLKPHYYGSKEPELVKIPEVVKIAEPDLGKSDIGKHLNAPVVKGDAAPEVEETPEKSPELPPEVPEEEGVIYMLIPGVIRIEGIKHNFDAKRLMKEYGLKKENCIEKSVAKAQGLDVSKLIPLRARPEGHYKEFLQLLKAKRK